MLLNNIPVFKFAAKIGGCAEKQGGKLKKVQNFSGLGASRLLRQLTNFTGR